MEANGYIKRYAETVGNRVSYKLKISHILNFHALIGSCLKDEVIPRAGYYIDLRVHPFIIRESGSGKALSYGLAEQLSEKVGLKWVTRNKITPAGLVGTVRRVKGGETEIVCGDAYDSDIIGFTEATSLLRDTKLRKIFNTLMDTKGIVSRRLASGEVTYKSSSTVVLSSFQCKLVYDHLQTGFLQRCFLYFEPISTPYIKEVMEWLANRYGIDKRVSVKQDLAVIAKQLIKIRKTNFNFKVDKQAKKELHSLGLKFSKMITPYPEFQEEVLRTFGTRWSEQVMKLSAHHASLELRNTIDKTDVEYGIRIGMLSLQSAFNFIGEYYAKDKTYRRLERQLSNFREKGKTVTLSQLSRNLKPMNVEQIEKMLEAYEVRGELTIDRKKRIVKFK